MDDCLKVKLLLSPRQSRGLIPVMSSCGRNILAATSFLRDCQRIKTIAIAFLFLLSWRLFEIATAA
jgi:hypothetical protein